MHCCSAKLVRSAARCLHCSPALLLASCLPQAAAESQGCVLVPLHSLLAAKHCRESCVSCRAQPDRCTCVQ